MAMRGGRGPAAVVAAMIAVLVAGCTGGADPVETTTPTVTTSPEPSPSPTPSPTVDVAVPPERPAAMATPSADGAAAAASYYMLLYTYSRVSGDPSQLAELSGPDCSTCSAIIEQIDATREAGTRAEGYAVTVHEAIPAELVSGESFTVQLRLTEGAGAVRDEAGTLVSETVETDRILKFGLRWNGGWTVEALGVEAAE